MGAVFYCLFYGKTLVFQGMKVFENNNPVNPLKEKWTKQKSYAWLSLFFSVLAFFLPFLAVLGTPSQGNYTFVSGFSSFVYLQDRQALNLYISVSSYIVSYALSLFLLIFSLMALGWKEEKKEKRAVIALFITYVCKIAAAFLALGELFPCRNMNIYPEYGSYLDGVLPTLFLIAIAVLYFVFRPKSKKVD